MSDREPPVVLYPTSRPISRNERAIPSRLLAMAADLVEAGSCRRERRLPGIPGATGPRRGAWAMRADTMARIEYERKDRELIRITMPDGIMITVQQPGSSELRPFISPEKLIVERLRLASFCLSGERDHAVDLNSLEKGYGMGDANAFLKALGGSEDLQYMLRSPYKPACILDRGHWADDGIRDLFGETHAPTILVFTEPAEGELGIGISSIMGNARDFGSTDPVAVLRHAARIAEHMDAVRR